jgi:hypothetical protein
MSSCDGLVGDMGVRELRRTVCGSFEVRVALTATSFITRTGTARSARPRPT